MVHNSARPQAPPQFVFLTFLEISFGVEAAVIIRNWHVGHYCFRILPHETGEARKHEELDSALTGFTFATSQTVGAGHQHFAQIWHCRLELHVICYSAAISACEKGQP